MNSHQLSTLQTFILALAFSSIGLGVYAGLVYTKNFYKTINVKGLDEQFVDADQAVWTLEFKVSGDRVEEIYQRSEVAMKQVMNFLEQQGFAALEIEKQGLRVNENMQYGASKNQLPDFTGLASILIVTDKVAQVRDSSQALAELLKLGVYLNNSRVVYNFTSLNSIKNQMLEKATLNAKEAAAAIALHTGGKVGKIKSASQGFFSINNATEGTNYDVSTIQKRVRVVTQVDFFLD